MGHLTTNGLNQAPVDRGELKYARMILGKHTATFSTSAPNDIGSDGATRVRFIRPKAPEQPTARGLAKYVVPRPQTSDRFALYQGVVADLLVLLGFCLLPTLVSPAWVLPADALTVYLVLVTLFGFSEGLYKSANQSSMAALMPVVAKSVLFASILVFIGAHDDTPLPAFPATLLSSFAGLVLLRHLQFLHAQRRHRADSRNVLIVGTTPAARAIAYALRDDPAHRTTVRGFLDDLLPLSSEVLGRVADLDWLARAEFIDEVILAVPHHPAQTRAAADIAYRNHLDIRAVPDLPPGSWPEARIERIGEVPVVTLHKEPLPSALLFLKRLLDCIGALLALVLAGPLMAMIALLIRLDSPGPIFYAAERAGARGRPFRCYKFRSMSVDADRKKEGLRARNQRQGPIFKIEGDPRITRFGRLLRRFSLDELPQLWNVVRGDMSLVGPRPHPVDEVHHYELHHYRRLDVKPGITGLWQITARSNPSFELNMHLDLTYIENWTLLLDLRILMGTMRVLFSPEGA